MPSIAELLTYGPAAFILDQRREQQAATRQSALDNAEQQGRVAALQRAGVADGDALILAAPNVRALSPAEQAQLPDVASGQVAPDALSYRQQAAANAAAQLAREQLGQSFTLADAGIDEHKLAQTRGEQVKTTNFLQFAQALADAKAAGRPLNAWEVLQGNFALGKELKPVDVQGDTIVNPYDTATPVLGTTPLGQARIGAEQALTGLRTASAGDETAQGRLHAAQADQAEMLAAARRDLLSNPNAPELLKLDALGGNHQLFKGSLVKVRKQDGTEVYMRETPNVSGGFDYTPALGPDDEPLLVPALGGGDPALIRIAHEFADVYGLTYEDAMTMARQGKGQTDAQIAQGRWKAAWTEAGKDVRAMGKPDQQRAIAIERYRAAWGTEPPFDLIQGSPQLAARGGGTPARSGQGQPAAPAAAGQPARPDAAGLLAQARAAIGRGKSREAVIAKLRELGVDPGGL